MSTLKSIRLAFQESLTPLVDNNVAFYRSNPGIASRVIDPPTVGMIPRCP